MVGRTLSEIASILDLSWVVLNKKDYRIVNTKEKLYKVLPELNDAKFIVLDTETTGTNICCLPYTDSKKDTCVGFSITWKRNQGIYIPLQHTEFDNMPMDIVIDVIFPILREKPSGAHNALFDYKTFYDMGCKLNLVHDSLQLLFNIYSKTIRGQKALKNATRLLYGHTTIEFEDIFTDKKDYTQFKHVDEEVCRIYTCADTDYCFQILLDNFNFLDERQKIAYMTDVSFIPLVAIAEYYGKPIDMATLPKCIDKCRQNISTIEETLFNYVGWKLTGDLNSSFRFKATSGQELVDVLYNKLGYNPVQSFNKTGYKIDKFVLDKLAKDEIEDDEEEDLFIKTKLKFGINNLLEDIDENGNQDAKLQLLSYKNIRTKKCLPAHLILILRKQYKYLTSFFLKIINEGDKDNGIFFSSISTTGTETARLVDFLQTLDSGLKYLVAVPDIDKKYMFVFDFAQIEYRVMVALAKMKRLITKLDNPHVDFHVEVAAILLQILPELVDKKTRKKFKPINFGIPYGIGPNKLVDNIYGVGLSKKEKELRKKEVIEMLDLWMNGMHEIMDMLNGYRKIARQPRKYEHPLTSHIENTSYIHTPDGRCRVFDLKDGSEQTLSKIDRMAGNTPIQNYARTIYLTAIRDFYNECVKLGLSDTLVKNPDSITGLSYTSKLTIHAFVHDEIIGMVDNDVNPYFLYNLIEKYCMKKIPGHPTYYCGINICSNWYEGKYGDYEAPIDFVNAMKSDTMIVSPRNDWPDIVAKDMVKWVNKDSIRYVESICGNKLLEDNVLDVDYLLSKWTDYYYTTKVNEFGFSYRGFKNEENSKDEKLILVLKLVGILMYYKYDKLLVVWKSRSMIEEVTTKPDAKFDGTEKELDLEHTLISMIDYEEYEDYPDDTELLDMYGNISGCLNDETTEEFCDKQANVAKLLNILLGG